MKNIFAIFFALFFCSCDIINPKEQIPSYLKIEKVNFDASPNFSSNSENISDAWVYVNSNLIGAFEIPFEVPILSEGQTQIRIIPGIYRDGISSVHHFYPYYTSFDTTLFCESEKTYLVNPTIKYNEAFSLIINEDFEGIDVAFETGKNSEFPLELTTNSPIDGLKSAYILADASEKVMEIFSKEFFQVITRTVPSYLEIDYISSVEFDVGVITEGGLKNFELRLRPNALRKKIYVDISAEVGVFNPNTKFKIYFEAKSTKSGDYIGLDNIRLLIPN